MVTKKNGLIIKTNLIKGRVLAQSELPVAETDRQRDRRPLQSPAALTARSQTHFPPALFSLHPLSSITSTPPCPPRFCAQELHGEQQRRRTECQPPDSRQGLLGVDGLRPPERRGVRVLFVRGKSKFIPLRTATQEKEDKKKKPNKQKKNNPPRKLAPHCLTIRVYL